MEKSTEIFTTLTGVSSLVKDMSSELQPAIEALDQKKQEKTRLTERLRNAILEETGHIFEGSWFNDLVSTYHDRELTILNEAAAIRQVINFANDYLEKTGVDIIGALLKLQLTNVKARVEADPMAYGLQPITNVEGVTDYYSKGMELKAVKKVRVGRDV